MPERLRIFISSPGDVIPERRRAALVIQKLGREFERFFNIASYLWESEPMLASGHFQDLIEPPSRCDIVLLILWARLGTDLPKETQTRAYRGIDGHVPVTGTEWEFEEALAAQRANGAPDLLAYRKTQPAMAPVDDDDLLEQELAQRDKLRAFWARHFEDRGIFRAGYAAFDGLDAFEAKLEADLRTLIERRIEARHPADRAGQPVSWPGNPFRGLQAYDFAHAPVFFGREAAIKRAVERLAANEAEGSAFLLILGSSGSGKSSLTRAGVLPRLFAPGVIPCVGRWRHAIFRPGDAEGDLFEGVARALIAPGALPELVGPETNAAELGTHLRVAAAHPDLPFRTALERIAAEARARSELLGHETVRLALVVDQLEELFTAPGVSPEDRAAFVMLLAALARSRLVWVVATMRSDFWHRAAEVPALVDLAEGHGRLDLLAPDQAEIAEMVRRPAAAAGLAFETHPDTGLGLDAVLTEAAAKSGGVLPLLSFVLDELYKRDGGRNVLGFGSYEAVGRLQGAIGRRAEEVHAALAGRDAEAAACLPRLLRRLVTIGAAGEEPTGRAASLDDFGPGTAGRRLVDALLAPEARLLVSEGDGAGAHVRVAHEALMRNWPRAAEQIQRDRRDLETRARLEEQEALWREASARDQPKRLLTGLALEEGRDLDERWGEELSPGMRQFVAASSRQAKRRQRRLQAAAAVFALLAVSATLAAGWAYTAQEQAEAERARAERSLAAAKQTIDVVIVHVAQELRTTEGVRAVTIRGVLDRLEETIDDLVESIPDDVDLQRSQSLMLREFADTYQAAGDTIAALVAAKEALAINHRLAQQDSDNGRGQQALVMSLLQMGYLEFDAGNSAAARAAYEEGLVVSRRLAEQDPTNMEWQHTVELSLDAIGDLEISARNAAAALAAYEEALAISRRLAALSPDNKQFQKQLQRDLSTQLHQFGIAKALADDRVAALAAQKEALAITRGLVELDPNAAQLRRDMAFTLWAVGELERLAGNTSVALTAHEEALAIVRRQAELDPENVDWKRDLVVGLYHVGTTSAVNGSSRTELIQEALAILNELDRRGALSGNLSSWQKPLQAMLDAAEEKAR
jgi:tetratricopeptide (TPR) repeat protein